MGVRIMAFCNLKAEMARVKVSQADVAEFLRMSTSNFNLKINERIPITVQEAEEIKNRFFPGLTLDYLFASDGDVPSKELRATARVESIADAMLDGHEDDPEIQEIADHLRETARCVDSDRVLRILG